MSRRPPAILILGLPYFGRRLQDTLREQGFRARFASHPGRNLTAWRRLVPLVARADLIYYISSRVERSSPQALLGAVRRKPTVIHWVGTDVPIAKAEIERRRASLGFLSRTTHFADAPWLVDELAELGVPARFVPLPVAGLPADEPAPLPERFAVLQYLPVDAFDREVFDLPAILALPERFPSISFTLIPSPAATLPSAVPANVRTPGWVSDMDLLYRETTVYVRQTTHDGTSFMAIEALARGRHVIWSHPLPGAIFARGIDAVASSLEDLIQRHRAGRLELNRAGRDAVMAAFDPARLSQQLGDLVREALGR